MVFFNDVPLARDVETLILLLWHHKSFSFGLSVHGVFALNELVLVDIEELQF